MTSAKNFTDRKRADIYVRDRATCGYTGKNLWLLDYGADPYYQIDWADHRVPVARGGKATLANGVCAGWSANFDKRDRTDSHICWFISGQPTPAYLETHLKLPHRIEQQFRRFSRLHHSDWYFNRALFRLWLGIAYLSEEGCTRVRDDLHYARSSYRIIGKWMRITKRQAVPSLEARGLVPRSLSRDQRLMLSIRKAKSVSDVRRLMRQLLPFYVARL